MKLEPRFCISSISLPVERDTTPKSSTLPGGPNLPDGPRCTNAEIRISLTARPASIIVVSFGLLQNTILGSLPMPRVSFR